MAVEYYEMAASRSPSTAGFSQSGGKATMPFLVDEDDVQDAISELLGAVKVNGDGRLKRVLPRRHPTWPWMHCSAITSIQGIGTPSQAIAAQDAWTETVIPVYVTYPYWIFNCEFAPRPYDLLDDADIAVLTAEYYDDAGDPQNQSYAEEYKRFVEVEFQPQPEIVTAQYGQMVYYTDSGGAPDGKPFAAAPKTIIPKGVLKVRWNFVPFELALNQASPVFTQLGRVNQEEFTIGKRTYQPGQLLYLGVGVKSYVPPKPEFTLIAAGAMFSTTKVCDMEFIFELTARTATDAPIPYQQNWIADGHNALPWMHKPGKYFYVTTKSATSAGSIPTYLSFPFQWLFTHYSDS